MTFDYPEEHAVTYWRTRILAVCLCFAAIVFGSALPAAAIPLNRASVTMQGSSPFMSLHGAQKSFELASLEPQSFRSLDKYQAIRRQDLALKPEVLEHAAEKARGNKERSRPQRVKRPVIADLEESPIPTDERAQWQPLRKAAGHIWPLEATVEQRISSNYGRRIHPVTGKPSFHSGVDLAAATGTHVFATADGTVETAGRDAKLGNYIEIAHRDGSVSIYGHLSAMHVHAGQPVTQGAFIGEVGTTGRSTGPHLHYTLKMDGHTVNPLAYLPDMPSPRFAMAD